MYRHIKSVMAHVLFPGKISQREPWLLQAAPQCSLPPRASDPALGMALAIVTHRRAALSTEPAKNPSQQVPTQVGPRCPEGPCLPGPWRWGAPGRQIRVTAKRRCRQLKAALSITAASAHGAPCLERASAPPHTRG